jgi:surface antigen
MRVASPRIVSLVVLAMLPGLVAACGPDNLHGGLLLGAFTSSSAGTQAGNGHDRAATTAAGAVIGGIGSNEVGRQMSDRERRIAANAEYRALEYGRSGAPTAWDYPATSHRGSIVPGRPYKKDHQYCRTYTHTINRGGPAETVKGIACREPNGTWRSVG